MPMHNPYQAQIQKIEDQIQANQKLLADREMAELARLELSKLEQQKKQLQKAEAELLAQQEVVDEQGQNSEKVNCTIEFRSGAGGDEAKIWADDLKRMYIKFVESLGLKLEFIDDTVLKIKGKTTQLSDLNKEGKNHCTAWEILQHESGVHRVQRVPVTEAQGRIHTSTATVAVLPEVSKTAVTINDDDLDWQFMRSSGAGGQSVNKTSSAVRLTHLPTGIVVTARQERQQNRNREIALDLLRAQLWEIEEEKRLAAIGQARSAIGRARRSEKIRTYNFPQNRVTDHRTKQSWYNLPEILEGNLGEMLVELHAQL